MHPRWLAPRGFAGGRCRALPTEGRTSPAPSYAPPALPARHGISVRPTTETQPEVPLSTRTLALAFALALGAALPAAARAQDTADFFKKSCTSCHTIGGGPLTGPDLKDVAKRAERAWLESFIQNPQAAIDKGDPYALKLQREARGVVMPRIDGMSPERAKALLDLVEAESKLEKSRFAGAPVSDRPFVPEDIALGRGIFSGATPLKNGGPACIACHALGGLGALGGGRLGPDLTDAFGRLDGRKALSAWLSNPATPTMASLFGRRALEPDEILPLVALLQNAAETRSAPNPADGLNFLVLGLGAVGAVLVGFDLAWKRRFRAVRGPLVLGGRL
jgi:ubiquinol-cytochrome c reductase cytochrome c subunit